MTDATIQERIQKLETQIGTFADDATLLRRDSEILRARLADLQSALEDMKARLEAPARSERVADRLIQRVLGELPQEDYERFFHVVFVSELDKEIVRVDGLLDDAVRDTGLHLAHHARTNDPDEAIAADEMARIAASIMKHRSNLVKARNVLVQARMIAHGMQQPVSGLNAQIANAAYAQLEDRPLLEATLRFLEKAARKPAETAEAGGEHPEPAP